MGPIPEGSRFRRELFQTYSDSGYNSPSRFSGIEIRTAGLYNITVGKTKKLVTRFNHVLSIRECEKPWPQPWKEFGRHRSCYVTLHRLQREDCSRLSERLIVRKDNRPVVSRTCIGGEATALWHLWPCKAESLSQMSSRENNKFVAFVTTRTVESANTCVSVVRAIVGYTKLHCLLTRSNNTKPDRFCCRSKHNTSKMELKLKCREPRKGSLTQRGCVGRLVSVAL